MADSAANEVIRDALAPYPDDLVIVTKVGPRRDPDYRWLDWAPARGACGRTWSGTSPKPGLDLFEVVNYRSNGQDVAAAVAALAALRDEGLLRHVGVSNVDVAGLEAALGVTDLAWRSSGTGTPGYERADGCRPRLRLP